MLDITYFSLIDAGIPIEDITTPAGRLWQYGVLNNCHEIEGVTAVLWGEIFWIVVWFCLSSVSYRVFRQPVVFLTFRRARG